MGWQFRRSNVFGPFRLTATRRGLSFSAGGRFGRVSVNDRGEVRETTRIPGPGLYRTKRISAPRSPSEPATQGPPGSDASPDLPPPTAAPGWHVDPSSAERQRYWDGQHWTEDVKPR